MTQLLCVYTTTLCLLLYLSPAAIKSPCRHRRAVGLAFPQSTPLATTSHIIPQKAGGSRRPQLPSSSTISNGHGHVTPRC